MGERERGGLFAYAHRTIALNSVGRKKTPDVYFLRKAAGLITQADIPTAVDVAY